jgi:predicted SnoaL-like aldol condensation-catalyzing enzyme
MKQASQSEAARQIEIERRSIAIEFFQLVAEGKFKDGLKFFTADCKTHNPYIAGDMNTLTDGMIAANKNMNVERSEADFKVKHILVEGDLVAVNTELLMSRSNPGKGGLRQVHLFRFEGNKIAEYWDITQQILESMPNAKGAF